MTYHFFQCSFPSKHTGQSWHTIDEGRQHIHGNHDEDWHVKTCDKVIHNVGKS